MEEQEAIIERLAEPGFNTALIWRYIFAGPTAGVIHSFERRYSDDGYTLYQLELRDEGSGLFEPKGYNSYLVRVPEMPHGTYAGIDTFQLEKRFKAMDWDFAQRNFEYKRKETDDLFKALHVLFNCGSPEAATIAGLLKNYYIAPQHSPEIIYARHYFELRGDLSDFHIREAHNLLSGRAVVKFDASLERPHTFFARWAVLENETIYFLPEFNVGDKLRALHIEEANGMAGGLLLYHFLWGERQMVHTTIDGKRTPIYIEADPRNQGFRFFDLRGIPLDPAMPGRSLLTAQQPLKEQPIPGQSVHPEKKQGKGKHGNRKGI